jgi:hypothetical protein
MFCRRFLLPAVCCLLSALCLLASDTPGTNNARKFNPTISESRILSNIYYLASEECEGRGSTTQGIHKAADYIVDQLKQAGLQPAGQDGGYFQYFDFARGARPGKDNELKFTIGSDTIECGKDNMQALGVGNKGSGSANVVFLGYGLTCPDPKYDDYEGVDVTGKVIIITRRTPRQNNQQKPNFEGKDDSLAAKIALAAKHNVAAVLVVSDGPSATKDSDKLANFNAFGTRADKASPAVFHVKRAIIDQVLSKADDKTLDKLEQQIDADFKPVSFELKGVNLSFKADVNRDPNRIKNILATVPGAGELAEEIVVVGSHYDHVGRGETGSLAGSHEIHPGADDNGSGSVCNLEVARRWQQMQSGPDALKNRRKVVFMWYAAEEWGLIGSEYYVNHPIYPLERIASMLNFDMVGRLGFDERKASPGSNAEETQKNIEQARKGKYPLEIIGTTTAKGFPAIVETANKDLGVEVTTPPGSQFFSASDHFSFYRKNIPVMFFFTGLHPQYHRPLDTWNTVNVPGIRQCAELGQNVLEGLATMTRPQFQKLGPPTRPTSTVAPTKKVETPASAPKKGEAAATPSRSGMSVSIGIQPSYGDTGEGVLITDAFANRAAAKAGIRANDRIIEVAGEAIKPVEESNIKGYMALLGKFKPGDKVELTVLRGGEKVKVSVTLEAPRN